jgi:hypothetical protein
VGGAEGDEVRTGWLAGCEWGRRPCPAAPAHLAQRAPPLTLTLALPVALFLVARSTRP